MAEQNAKILRFKAAADQNTLPLRLENENDSPPQNQSSKMLAHLLRL